MTDREILQTVKEAMIEIGLGTYFRKPHEMRETAQWQKIQMIEKICRHVKDTCSHALSQ